MYYLITLHSLTLLASAPLGRDILIWGKNIANSLHSAPKHIMTEKIKVVSNRFHKFLKCRGVPDNAVIKKK
jgi:hypothetical protein